MTSATTSGALSGAASGAAAGSVAGPWGIVIGGVIGGVAGLISGSSADAQADSQSAWAEYNNIAAYNQSVRNVQSAYDIANYNAEVSLIAADFNAKSVEASSARNAAVILQVADFNDTLLEIQLEALWGDLGLDLELLGQMAAREKGTIVADQAASGTIIGEGSNVDVVTSQQAQRALDANIIMFDADRQAANIQNARTQGRWEAKTAASNVVWEGQQAAYTSRVTTALTTNASRVTSSISSNAQVSSAGAALTSGASSIAVLEGARSTQNTQNLVAGLFQAAGTAAQSYSTTQQTKLLAQQYAAQSNQAPTVSTATGVTK